ncbi:MAG: RNA polymerase sigma factor for flagellar operon FliA [Planctomycetota bacterium]|jgi:RNA polymerase sigma factor for flagellar operon FliA
MSSDERSVLSEEEKLSDRDKRILDHLPLLHYIVGRIAIEVPAHIDRDDLLSFGMIGLVSASDSWDASRGLKFSTYAYPRMRGAILDELRHMDFLPRGRREKVRALDKVVAKLEQANGTPPSPEELAEELGTTVEEVGEILVHARVAGVVSLDDTMSTELGALLADPRSENPEGTAEWEEMKQLVVEAIKSLSEQEQTVITLYYGEELLLKEIAEVMSLTESRISQVHTAALYRLNRELRVLAGGGFDS